MLAAAVAAELRLQGRTVALAESCTGGWIAKVLTDLAGSSQWFERGWVTYSNRAKTETLGVSALTLERFGAVSESTVAEMVVGAQARAGVDYAVAVSGVAGPDGGTPEKPVGTVCFGWVGLDGAPETITEHFEGDRETVRRLSVARALNGLLERI